MTTGITNSPRNESTLNLETSFVRVDTPPGLSAESTISKATQSEFKDTVPRNAPAPQDEEAVQIPTPEEVITPAPVEVSTPESEEAKSPAPATSTNTPIQSPVSQSDNKFYHEFITQQNDLETKPAPTLMQKIKEKGPLGALVATGVVIFGFLAAKFWPSRK